MAASFGRRSRARPRHLHRRKPRASKRAKNPLMRHRNYGSKLGRQPAHRRATLRNLVTNVIERERITTTLTRARAAKPLVEQMITLGKRDTLHSRRQAAAYLMTPRALRGDHPCRLPERRWSKPGHPRAAGVKTQKEGKER